MSFFHACVKGDLILAKEFYHQDGIDVASLDTKHIFKIVCNEGYLEVVKWLCSIGVEIPTDVYNPFSGACIEHFDIAEYLYYTDKTIIFKTFGQITGQNNSDFEFSCLVGNLLGAKKLYNTNIGLTFDYCYMFSIVCRSGYLELAKWLDSVGGNTNTKKNKVFAEVCCRGHIDLAKWLYDFGVDIHYKNDLSFRLSCVFEKIDVAKWLYSVGANIRSCTSHAFGCTFNNASSVSIEIAKWLYEIDDRVLIDTMKCSFFTQDLTCKRLQEIGLDYETSKQIICIKKYQELEFSNEINDIVIKALFEYHRIEVLEKLNLSYVSFEVVNDKIINPIINRITIKSARSV